MNRTLMTLASAGLALMAVSSARAEGETATWTAGSGAWEMPGNWDVGVVPGATTNVRFNASDSAPNVTASSELDPIATMFVSGKGVNFQLGTAAKMTVTDVITNYNSVSYSGGAYDFGGDLIVGLKKGWSGDSQSFSTTASFVNNARAEIAGKIWVTGYSGNGLRISGGSFVKCAGYKDAGGTRNKTIIGSNGTLHSTGDISVYDSWPDAGNPTPFTVDGGTVTNAGNLTTAEGNAGRVPFVLQNGAKWRQYGLTTIGNKNADNSMTVQSGSTFESSSNIVFAAQRGQKNIGLTVDGNSTFSAKSLYLGNSNYQTNLWVRVLDGSSLALTGAFDLGKTWGAENVSLVVSGGSSVSAKSFTCSSGGSGGNLSVAVTNSTLTVTTDAASFPYDASGKRCDLVFSGSAGNPSTVSFPGGLVIGAGASRKIDKSSNFYMRTEPTTVLVDNSVVTVGKDVDGTTSGDLRLGGYNVGGVYDLATNRLIVAGEKGCFVARHRWMAAGNPVIELRVPAGGYQNEYGCALYVKNAYLTGVNFVIDLSAVEPEGPWKEYQLAYSTVASGDLNIDTNKISVIAPEKCKYELVSSKKKLSIKVRRTGGLLLIFR